ncbi:MAG TPA: TIGR03085 family metal-binding protein [Sporichthyaceae bacterium]|jgi:uncharacterized protein (TIGR03085 family)
MAEYFDASERAQLCDLLDRLGPDAPTVPAGWTTFDLLTHLVQRERDPIGAPGIVIPGPWRSLSERRRDGLKDKGFTELVGTLRSGPPRGFFRLPWVRKVPNLNEFFVHHEDVRRANGMGPRLNQPGLDEALWHNVKNGAWLLTRRVRGPGLELAWAGTPTTHRARGGQPVVRLSGAPGELLLYLFGRREVAEVELSGPPDAVEIVRRARFGM